MSGFSNPILDFFVQPDEVLQQQSNTEGTCESPSDYGSERDRFYPVNEWGAINMCARADVTSDDAKTKQIFEMFDRDGDSFISYSEFEHFLDAVFCNNRGIPYQRSSQHVRCIFRIFDSDNDRKLNFTEFQHMWRTWMKTVFDPISAFVVVDMQNDFLTEGGSMPLMKYKGSEDAEKLVGRVNFILSNYAEDFKCIAFTQDWHPPNHCSFLKNLPKAKVAKTSKISSNKAGPFDTVLFEGNPPYEQRMWPTHCIQHTPGADLHKDLLIGKKCALIRKGYLSCVDCESAFWNRNRMGQTDLPRLLASHKVTDVYICGVPYDLTVYQSVMDSLGFGYKTILLHDICRGVEEEAIVDSDYRIIRKNGLIANTEDLSDLMYCLDRPFVMGLQGLTKLLMDRVVTLKVK